MNGIGQTIFNGLGLTVVGLATCIVSPGIVQKVFSDHKTIKALHAK